ncbi:MAG: N-acetylglucosamine kinase [Rhizobiaceae bacterium]
MIQLAHPIFGIDGGGTGCRAVVCDADGNRLGQGKAGPSNIMTNLEGARDNIVEACRRALDDAGLDECALVASDAFLGVAGANVGDFGERIAAVLPFRSCAIGTDAAIALQGALGDSDGAVAIIGTGSVFISRSAGHIRSIGGWGFIVGDLGSGARLGRSLLQEALLVHDGVHAQTPLMEAVLKHFDNDPQAIVEFVHAARPAAFGTFAPMVFEYSSQNDTAARSILMQAVSDVEEMLDAILAGRDLPLCFLGGLGRKYRDWVGEAYRQNLVEPLGEAVDGAVTLALKRFAPAGDAR